MSVIDLKAYAADVERSKVPIVLVWRDGHREVIFGSIAHRVCVPDPRDFHPIMFDREVVRYPDGFCGPFQSFWYRFDDGFDLGETREIRYREAA